MATTRRQKLEAELDRLEKLLLALDLQWSKLPRLLALLGAAIPVAFIWGIPAALLVAGGVIALVSTAAYLIGVRRREYRREIADVLRELPRAGD